jgi:hypothetical protein
MIDVSAHQAIKQWKMDPRNRLLLERRRRSSPAFGWKLGRSYHSHFSSSQLLSVFRCSHGSLRGHGGTMGIMTRVEFQ